MNEQLIEELEGLLIKADDYHSLIFDYVSLLGQTHFLESHTTFRLVIEDTINNLKKG